MTGWADLFHRVNFLGKSAARSESEPYLCSLKSAPFGWTSGFDFSFWCRCAESRRTTDKKRINHFYGNETSARRARRLRIHGAHAFERVPQGKQFLRRAVPTGIARGVRPERAER